jgi:hypothetical protein
MLSKKSRLNQMLSSKWQCASTPFLEGKKKKEKNIHLTGHTPSRKRRWRHFQLLQTDYGYPYN